VDWIEFLDRAVFLPATGTLVLADTHVGRDEASEVEFPLGESADLEDRLTALLSACEPDEVVIAGDVLHRFDRASYGIADRLRTLTEACRDAGASPVLVAGNHDAMLDSVWDGEVHGDYRIEGVDPTRPDYDALVCHGHEEPDLDATDDSDAGGETPGCYVIGHDHPTIDIEGQRRPCFLFGESVYRDRDVLMLPAFTSLAAGVEINGMRASDFQSPLIRRVNELRPVVYDADAGESLAFPELGRFRRLL
jgi:putative SbcD/Mre11-related phosphoesterase